MVKKKVITLEAEEKLWKDFKLTVPRDINLNDAVIILIQNHVNQKKKNKKKQELGKL